MLVAFRHSSYASMYRSKLWTMRLFAGCGIVAGSDPAAELAETLVKFQPMRGALEG